MNDLAKILTSGFPFYTSLLMKTADLHLVDWLQRIQKSWELSLVELSRISHVSELVLGEYFKLSPVALAELPSVPTGLDSAVALVGLYRQLLKAYPEVEAQTIWLQKPNSVFEGQRPIDVMAMSADHLSFVAYSVESGLRLGERVDD